MYGGGESGGGGGGRANFLLDLESLMTYTKIQTQSFLGTGQEGF